jgi:hypothetical protein
MVNRKLDVIQQVSIIGVPPLWRGSGLETVAIEKRP